jgi:hypothetical protein
MSYLPEGGAYKEESRRGEPIDGKLFLFDN